MANATGAARVRSWMRQNPGQHFMGDIVDGMGISDLRDRMRVRQCIVQMTIQGILDAEGRRGMKKYRLGRTPRAHVRHSAGEAA